MQLDLPGRPHLTYCSNIHAGETWDEIDRSLRHYILRVKAEVSPDAPMGIGLRLSAIAAHELSGPGARARFKHFLTTHDCYVFTINAFPYGNFHGERVKERVYEPDWRSQERLRFTNQVADILDDIAPPGLGASISTVPGAFRANVTTPADIAAITEGFVRAAAHLATIRQRNGRMLALAIEPEPACFLETTAEAVRFFEDHLYAAPARALFSQLTGRALAAAEADLRQHITLCFDVCHSAVAFEETQAALDTVRSAGIGIGKLQLSSALRATGEAASFERLLGRFDDRVYLHQTVQRQDGLLTRYTDLPDAFASAQRGDGGAEWRVHCHVPVFLEHYETLGSTQKNLREALSLCRAREVSPHLEVETYTWAVLPSGARNGDLGDDIVRELLWVRSELGA